jgi:two-component system nitrate/nitrite response regulator NarL
VKRTRILVADGLTVFRAAVHNVLARERDFEVVEAASTAGVRNVLTGDRIDVALLDLGLPPDGALEAIELLRERGTDVIVWSFEPDQATVFDAIRAGASGYLAKDIPPDGLVRSLRGAVRGEAALSRELTGLMIEALHRIDERDLARRQVGSLSAREREVLAHVAEGARNRQIAAALSISHFTVKRHVQNILQKLGVESRTDAAAYHRAAFGAGREQVSA